MAEQAILSVSMDADLKEQVETLYQRLGMDFSDAVRMFAEQSLRVRGLPFPFQISEEELLKRKKVSVEDLSGCLKKYVTPERLELEKKVLPNAFERATLEKYGYDFDDFN